jgi:thioredoxin-related protein
VERDMAIIQSKAKNEQKHIMVFVGGNWCGWCYRLNNFIKKDNVLLRLLQDNYILYHLNFSIENKNLPYLAKIGNPQRFGFPVLVILDENGNLLHTQDSGLLQQGNLYSTEQISSVLNKWAPSSIANTKTANDE